MFPVILVPDDAPNLTEQIGTRSKFWFRDRDGVEFLFKAGRPNSGENWAEKASCELCNLVRLPHAEYELAMWKSTLGVVTRKFVPPDGALIHGNELLATEDPTYPHPGQFRVREHTLERVLSVVEDPAVRPPIGWELIPGVVTALDTFIGYLMFDAWIANQDRHHQNWGLVVGPDSVRYLAPSFDHASSMGRNETDSSRKDRLTTRDRGRSMENYVSRARSALYASPSDSQPLRTIDAFRAAVTRSPSGGAAWLTRLESVGEDDIRAIFERMPTGWITDFSAEFAVRLLVLNKSRLSKVFAEMQ